MPYIKQLNREKWANIINEVTKKLENVPDDEKEGELNFLITSILKKSYPPKYKNYNSIMGLLECVKQEFYRRFVGQYEDKKIKENGDID